MKKLFIIFFSFILFFSSCKKVDKTVSFDVSYQTDFIIDASIPLHTETTLNVDPVSTNISDVLDSKDSSVDLINQMKLTKIKLTITNPATQNFDFLSDSELYLKASGLPNIRIAWKNNMTNNLGNSIELILLSDDIKSYLKEDNVTFSLKIIKDEVTTQDVNIQADIFIKVEADLLGK